MRIFTLRVITIGFILGFVHLVTTPVPVLCSHSCGEIHLMGAAEHLGHCHETDHHDHGSHHRIDLEGNDSGSCVDVHIVIDTVLTSASSGPDDPDGFSGALLAVTAPPRIHVAPPMVPGDDSPWTPIPLRQLGRLLI